MVYFVALLIFIGVFIIVDWLLEMNPQDTNVGLTAGATADDAFDYAGLMQHVARFDVALGDDEHLRIAQLAGLA